VLGYGEIFTIFFVTLGPLKVLGPFAQRTHGLDDTAVRRIAVRAFLIATVAIVVGALAGRALADNWNISIAAMVITAGIIFFLVAIRQILDQYEATSHPPPEPLPAAPMAAALRVVFPAVLTPYGIAAAIAMVSATRDLQRIEMIIALLVPSHVGEMPSAWHAWRMRRESLAVALPREGK